MPVTYSGMSTILAERNTAAPMVRVYWPGMPQIVAVRNMIATGMMLSGVWMRRRSGSRHTEAATAMADGDTADGHEPHIPSRPDEFARPEGLADGGHRAAHGGHRQSHEHHMALGDQADGCLHFRADAPARPHVGDADDELTEQHDALRPGQVPDGVDAFGVQFHMGMGVGGLMEAYAPCRPAQDDERREARNQGSISIGSEEPLCLPYSQKHPHPPLCFRAMGAAWCGAVSADVSFRSGAGRSSRIPGLLSACS